MCEKLPLKGPHSHMSPEEIEKWYSKLKEEHEQHLEQDGVGLPRKGSAKALWLVYLRKYQGRLVHKDTISAFIKTVNPKLGHDQQVRHLAADGWYVLNKGDFLPNSKETVGGGLSSSGNHTGSQTKFYYQPIEEKGANRRHRF